MNWAEVLSPDGWGADDNYTLEAVLLNTKGAVNSTVRAIRKVNSRGAPVLSSTYDDSDLAICIDKSTPLQLGSNSQIACLITSDPGAPDTHLMLHFPKDMDYGAYFIIVGDWKSGPSFKYKSWAVKIAFDSKKQH